jgi:hypothetical protein
MFERSISLTPKLPASNCIHLMPNEYPADHPLASEFEKQMTTLIRDYTGEGEYLAVHHPDEPDAPDSTALALLASVNGTIAEILFA